MVDSCPGCGYYDLGMYHFASGIVSFGDDLVCDVSLTDTYPFPSRHVTFSVPDLLKPRAGRSQRAHMAFPCQIDEPGVDLHKGFLSNQMRKLYHYIVTHPLSTLGSSSTGLEDSLLSSMMLYLHYAVLPCVTILVPPPWLRHV